MSEPEVVEIGPYEYRVICDATRIVEYEHRNQAKVWGTILYGTTEILLDPAQNVAKRRVTLLHELLHGCTDIAGVFGADSEEKILTALAPLLLDMLRRNPGLVTYLMAVDP